MRTKWEIFDLEKNLFFPTKPACYVFYLDGKPSYVGQASNLHKRILNHNIRLGWGSSWITPWGCFKNVFVKVRFSDKYGDWAMREMRLIKKLRPKFNISLCGRKRKPNNA